MNTAFARTRAVGLSIAIHSALVLLASALADKIPPHNITGFINPTLTMASPEMAKLLRWDAHWYTYIAEYGYSEQAIVFFPALVMGIKMLVNLGMSYFAAGLLLCNILTVLSFCLLYMICRLDFSRQQAAKTLLCYAVMPTSFFLNSIYTEALFMVFALGCVYFTRVGKWWPAGIMAALAALTRNLGIFLVLFMAYEYWLVYRHRPKIELTALPMLFAPLALLTFMAYNFMLVGDPLAFAHAQVLWGRQFGWPWMNIWHEIMLLWLNGFNAEPGMILDLFMVMSGLIALVALTFSRRFTIRSSYLIVGWLWFLIPLCSTSPIYPLYSMSRFVLVIFPLYLFWPQLSWQLFGGYIVLSALALAVCAALFMNWYWLG